LACRTATLPHFYPGVSGVCRSSPFRGSTGCPSNWRAPT
jgi:hypothetical protein